MAYAPSSPKKKTISEGLEIRIKRGDRCRKRQDEWGSHRGGKTLFLDIGRVVK